MSWSVNVPAYPAAGCTAAEFADAVKAANLEDGYNAAPLVEQWSAQLEAAKTAALAIIEAMPFGEGGTYRASFTGHANHAGAGDGTGYTESEFVHVTVSREPDR